MYPRLALFALLLLAAAARAGDEAEAARHVKRFDRRVAGLEQLLAARPARPPAAPAELLRVLARAHATLAEDWRESGDTPDDAWLALARRRAAAGDATAAVNALQRMPADAAPKLRLAAQRLHARLAADQPELPLPADNGDPRTALLRALGLAHRGEAAAAATLLERLTAPKASVPLTGVLYDYANLLLATLRPGVRPLADAGGTQRAAALWALAGEAAVRTDPARLLPLRAAAEAAGSGDTTWSGPWLEALEANQANAQLAADAAGLALRQQQAVAALRRVYREFDAAGPQTVRRLAAMTTERRRREPDPLADAHLRALVETHTRLAGLHRRLQDWQPYLAAEAALLKGDSAQLATAARSVGVGVGVGVGAAAAAPPAATADRNIDAEHFYAELAELLGPAPRSVALGLFRGLANWYFYVRYPPTWTPEKSDPARLTEALRQISGMNAQMHAELARLPQYQYSGLAEWFAATDQTVAALQPRLETMLERLASAIADRAATSLGARLDAAEQVLLTLAARALRAADRAESAPGPAWAVPKTLRHALAAMTPAAVADARAAATAPPAVHPAAAVDILERLAGEARAEAARVLARRVLADHFVERAERGDAGAAARATAHYRALLESPAATADGAFLHYQLAHAQELAGDLPGTAATLERFAAAYPGHALAAEVDFRRGELHFAFRDFERARAAYASVAAHDVAAFALQAEYKLAWSLFKLGEYHAALPRFAAVADARVAVSAAAGDGLLDDSLRALSLAFSYGSGVEALEAFFRRRGQRPYEARLYLDLARLHLDHERLNDAAATLDRFVDRFPDHAEAPALYAKLVEGYRGLNLANAARRQAEAFVARYGTDSRFWQRADAATRTAVGAPLTRYLEELGRFHHARAQAGEGPAAYREAARWYRRLVDGFPQAPARPAIHFLLAEALHDAGDHAAAAAAFETVAYGYGPHPKAAEAGYAHLLARQAQLEAAAPEDRTALREALVEAGRRFERTFAADPRGDKVLARVAEDLLHLGRLPEAVAAAGDLLARGPAAAEAGRGRRVLAHASFESGQFAQAEAAYRDALAREPAAADQAELARRYALAIYRQGEAAARNDDTVAAVRHLLRIREALPASDLLPSAEFDAATLLVAASRWAEAVPVLERFEREFGAHRLAAETTPKLALAYANSGRPLPAAALFERLSERGADPTYQRQSLWRAAELRRDAGARSEAIATFERYAQRFPQPLDLALEARQFAADGYAALGDAERRRRLLAGIVAGVDQAGQGADARARFLAAQAALHLADAEQRAFDAVALKLPLKRNLQRKKKAMEKALAAYDKAAAYTVAQVTTAATFQVAALYRSMGRALLDSERPAGLSSLEREQYDILLEEEALPFEEKAIRLHEANVARIRDGHYDGWVNRSLASLRELMPGRYGKTELAEGWVDAIP